MFSLPENFTDNFVSGASDIISQLAPIIAILGGIMLAFFVVEWLIGLIKPKDKNDDEKN